MKTYLVKNDRTYQEIKKDLKTGLYSDQNKNELPIPNMMVLRMRATITIRLSK